MLIIFDLDDTLIETSSVILPYKLKNLLEYFYKNKLLNNHFDNDYNILLKLTKNFSTKQALEIFLKKCK